MPFPLEYEGDQITMLIKNSVFFPFKKGNLKFRATQGHMVDANTYVIHFDSTIAPYVAALEEGSKPHNIPRAFGYNLPFGTFGRFEGKFHPGSDKHKGFIKNDCVNTIVDYLTNKFEGIVVVK